MTKEHMTDQDQVVKPADPISSWSEQSHDNQDTPDSVTSGTAELDKFVMPHPSEEAVKPEIPATKPSTAPMKRHRRGGKSNTSSPSRRKEVPAVAAKIERPMADHSPASVKKKSHTGQPHSAHQPHSGHSKTKAKKNAWEILWRDIKAICKDLMSSFKK